MYHCGTVRSLHNIKSHDHYDLKIHLRPHDIFNNGASIAYQLCSHYRHYTSAYSGRLGINIFHYRCIYTATQKFTGWLGVREGLAFDFASYFTHLSSWYRHVVDQSSMAGKQMNMGRHLFTFTFHIFISQNP
jgi:hypothetical protein